MDPAPSNQLSPAMGINPAVAVPPTIGKLTIMDIFKNVSNAVVGTVEDAFSGGFSVRGMLLALEKDQRYMYIALLVIVLIIVGDVMNTYDL